MPSLFSFLKNAATGSGGTGSSSSSVSGGSHHEHRADQTVTRYYLAPSAHFGAQVEQSAGGRSDAAFTPPALVSVPPPPSDRPAQIPPQTLLFSLSHRDPSVSAPTAFFLDCLPDPIGFIYHAANFIRARLAPSGHKSDAPDRSASPVLEGQMAQMSFNSGDAVGGLPELPWRHQMLHLELKDEPGLAATSGGKIVVSMQWVADIMREVKGGQRSPAAATHEFKGVLLHEMVHTIQHDGFGSEPWWLIESLADYVRLQARLGPPHWRVPGQGREERGWEEAYDSGARFLAWLTGWEEGGSSSPPSLQAHPGSSGQGVYGATATSSSAPEAQPTQYPSGPAPPAPHQPFPPPGSKPRRAPLPNLVRLLDYRLANERWSDSWWEEMTGAPLEVLWAEYLQYYR